MCVRSEKQLPHEAFYESRKEEYDSKAKKNRSKDKVFKSKILEDASIKPAAGNIVLCLVQLVRKARDLTKVKGKQTIKRG